MELPDLVKAKLGDHEAVVLPRLTPIKKGEMTICYHCDGKLIGETVFPYSRGAYAEWLRAMADALSGAESGSERH